MTHRRPLSRRRFLAGSAGLVAAGTLGGCLGSGPGSSEDDGGLPDRVEVVMTTTPTPMFDPRLAHVAVGGTVVWKLESGSHDTVAYHPDTYGPQRIPDGAEPWASPKLTGVGETFEHTFDRAGVYDYVDTEAVCISHEVAGNVGRVVVGWPDPDDEPAMQPLSEEEKADVPSRVQSAFEMFDEETRPVLEAGPS